MRDGSLNLVLTIGILWEWRLIKLFHSSMQLCLITNLVFQEMRALFQAMDIQWTKTIEKAVKVRKLNS